MWRLISKLLLILALIVALEAGLLPRLVPLFKPDLFIGLLIGVSIFLPFNWGFGFVLGSALVLQMFAGGRIGYLPFVYAFGFLALDLLKHLIFLENLFAQIFFGACLYLGVVYAAGFFVKAGSVGEPDWQLAVSAVVSGLVTPLMVRLVGRLWSEHEQS
jgi:hypothetical protein